MISQEININLVVSKVALGEGRCGLCSQARGFRPKYAEKLSVINLHGMYNVKSEYTLGLLDGSKRSLIWSWGFIALVESEKGKAILQKYGFDPISA